MEDYIDNVRNIYNDLNLHMIQNFTHRYNKALEISDAEYDADDQEYNVFTSSPITFNYIKDENDIKW